MSFSSSATSMRWPRSLRLSMAASSAATTWRLNSTCSRTCQSSTRATRRFQPWTSELTRPPGRGFTVPMAATLPSAASRACTRGMRSSLRLPWPAPTRSRTSRRMAISSALSTRPLPRPVPGGRDHRAEAAAQREIADYRCGDGIGGFHDVAQHAVDDVLLKDAQVAVGEQVHLVGFELEAVAVRHVAQHELAEIGQTGLGAHGSELVGNDFDFVIGILVGPGLDLGQGSIDARPGVFLGVSQGGCPGEFGVFHARAFASRSRNSPTSATTPMAWPVPRSLTLVATAGLMSTQTILTQLGSMLPVAIECSMEPRQITSPAPFRCAA